MPKETKETIDTTGKVTFDFISGTKDENGKKNSIPKKIDEVIVKKGTVVMKF